MSNQALIKILSTMEGKLLPEFNHEEHEEHEDFKNIKKSSCSSCSSWLNSGSSSWFNQFFTAQAVKARLNHLRPGKRAQIRSAAISPLAIYLLPGMWRRAWKSLRT